jgi:murein L,D-transpeptidase YafK
MKFKTDRRTFLRLSLGIFASRFDAASLDSSDGQPLSALVNPRIVVTKSKRTLQVFSETRLVRTYRIALGLSPVEDKVRAGDRRTPEGEFYICQKNPKSKFYLSLGISYPNLKHAERGLREGLINRTQYEQIIGAIKAKRQPPQYTRLGGEIFIHGNGSQADWTWGCVALDDKDIRELYDAIEVGTPVTIDH